MFSSNLKVFFLLAIVGVIPTLVVGQCQPHGFGCGSCIADGLQGALWQRADCIWECHKICGGALSSAIDALACAEHDAKHFQLISVIAAALDTNTNTNTNTNNTVDTTGYIPFNGVARVLSDNQYLLIDQHYHMIQISGKDVRFIPIKDQSEHSIYVKVDAPATVVYPVQQFHDKKSATLTATSGPCMREDKCPSRCAACIGLAKVCCGSGGIVGWCNGVVSCPG